MRLHFFNKTIIALCILVLLLGWSKVRSQTTVGNIDALAFNIQDKNESIDFIKLDKNLGKAKPTVIFCQGSLPIPLVVKTADNKFFLPAANFDYRKLSSKYNIIVVSMPHIPVVAEESNLNSQFAFITDKANPRSFPEAYMAADYLDNYTERGNRVVDFLLKQKWVQRDSIYIVGHSQGARVAAKIAAQNGHIAALGFFSGDPLGRATQSIRKIRLMQRTGQLSDAQAQSQIDGIYKKWEQFNKAETNSNTNSLISFSEPIVDELVNTKIPIYIAYGTEDLTAEFCDLLPIEFIRNKKFNYKLVAYPGLEHNFMEMDSNGKPDPGKFHWEEVFQGFINWLEAPNTFKQ
jgi:dienelactone hydrolase